MQSEVQQIKSAIRDRILQVANNVDNYRLDNLDYEMNLILTFLSELSYHEDLTECMNLCRNALLQLSTTTQQDHDLQQLVPPNITHASFSCRGRPAYNITEETLVFFIENSFTIKQMASMLVVSEKTVVNRMKEFGLSIRKSYSVISDEELLKIVKQKVAEFPSVGYRSIRGHLMSEGIKVTEARMRRIMRTVDPLGVLMRNVLCRTYRIRRRSYSVRAPRALWHVDSNHKLIRWRFIFHGGIDGYSRLPMYIKVASDNTADTAFAAFMSGVDKFGIPERVRTDKGLENIRIAEFMLQRQGLNRGSHITGRSVHNQRIERFWRELWDGCTKTYYELFQYMEHEGILNVDSEVHLLALHIVYLNRIQSSVDRFVHAVSRRCLRTEHNMTPLQLWIMGQMADTEDQPINSEDLTFYGVDFNCPEPVCEDNDIQVPAMLQLEQERFRELRERADQLVDTPYEVQTFMDICSHLSELHSVT